MVCKIALTQLVFLMMAALLSGCCNCQKHDLAELKELPPQVVAVLRPHFPVESKSSSPGPRSLAKETERVESRTRKENTLHRSDFTQSELEQLDVFITKRTGHPFDTVKFSDCGECTTGGGSKGVYIYFPMLHTSFCESCGS
jgi:hypothetical protein